MSADLWPPEIDSPPEVRPPSTILKEQAANLGKRTNNTVEGDVKRVGAGAPGSILYDFVLVAPTIAYQYKLFRIVQPITFYPLEIRADVFPGGTLTVNDETEFLQVLGDLFSNSKTIRIIQSLKAQSV